MFPPRYGGRGGRRRGGIFGQNPFLMLLFMQLAQQINRLPIKPPVTIGLMALQAYLWFGPEYGYLQMPQMDIFDVCASPMSVLEWGEWYRLLSSPFFHASDYHLYYNLSSFLYKGVLLENKLGSKGFLLLIAGLSLGSSLLYVLLATFLGIDDCVLGFSGVILALKFIVNYDINDQNGDSYFFGMRLPTKHVVWAEIILLYFISPESSLLGHISGALTGLTYVAFTRWFPFSRSFFDFIPHAGTNREPQFYGSGSWGMGNNGNQQHAREPRQHFNREERPRPHRYSNSTTSDNTDQETLRKLRVERLSKVGLSSTNR